MAFPQATVGGVVETSAIVVGLGSVAGYLPEVAAGLSILMMTGRLIHLAYKLYKHLRR